MESKPDINRVDISDIELDDIYQFMSQDKGEDNMLEGNPKILRYLDLMEKTQNMWRRINRYGNRESIINHLVKYEGLSKYHAQKLLENTLQYFYSESEISKEAWRNILAEKYIAIINLATVSVKDVKDMNFVTNMIFKLAKILNLDKEDTPELPEMKKPFNVITYDLSHFSNLPKFDKKKLGVFIDNMDLTEPEKLKLKQDAMLVPVELPFIEDNEQKN